MSVEWLTPSSPRAPYCFGCSMDGHTYMECPDRKRKEVKSLYQPGQRVRALYDLSHPTVPKGSTGKIAAVTVDAQFGWYPIKWDHLPEDIVFGKDNNIRLIDMSNVEVV